ncbi:MAG: transcriptional repressor NrdR, partial [Streptococcus sanguinis]|nr:transcriptional repressor NrdR [Streptococcus sanguinis]
EEWQHRFTTYERVEERTLVVVKKDGTREQFSRDKIFNGIIRSAQKRPVSSDEIEEIVNRIEQKVRSQSDNEINSEYIGSLVMDELAELDEITYVRFASVYRSFKDVGELESLLKQITKGSKKKKDK